MSRPDSRDRPVFFADLQADTNFTGVCRFFQQQYAMKAQFKAFRDGDVDWRSVPPQAVEPSEGTPKLEILPKLPTLDPDDWFYQPDIDERTGQWQRFSRGRKKKWKPEMLEYVRKVS